MGDLVLSQVVELQVDEQIPHVIPLTTPERVRTEQSATRHTAATVGTAGSRFLKD